MEHFGACPYCSRELTEFERFCFFCEQDIQHVRDEEEKLINRKHH